MVGSAVVRALQREGCTSLLLRSRDDLDLTDQAAVHAFFREARPEYVILAAARVGGILANSRYPADFLYENLAIAVHVIHAARTWKVRKLLNLGSSCIYPRLAPQPLREEYLLTGPLEPTNEAYAVAKIAAIKLCETYRTQFDCNFVSLMPTNLYGPGDNFDLQTSHVLPALIRKFHEGRQSGAECVTVWGTGRPRREFLHVDDLAEACLFTLARYDGPGFLNVGQGEDLAIADLARLVADVVGYTGRVEFDPTKPDGTPRKLLDVSRIRALGWAPRIPLRDGIAHTYEWFVRTSRAHAEAH
jgi:GDP-L-fucose synthase